MSDYNEHNKSHKKKKKPSERDLPPEEVRSLLALRTSRIANKAKRTEMYARQKHEKKKLKAKARRKRQMEEDMLDDEQLAKRPVKVQRTLETAREPDETMVMVPAAAGASSSSAAAGAAGAAGVQVDEEVLGDESMDEFASFFRGESKPKLLITTSTQRPNARVLEFAKSLLFAIPNSVYYKRRGYPLHQIVKFAKEKDFTDVVVLNWKGEQLTFWNQFHLPNGPSAKYKISGVLLPRDLPGRGRVNLGQPEVILNNFNTRLGRRVARMFGSLFDPKPDFFGRRVVTFHNQRDFIFFRHHRYVFSDDPEAEKEKTVEEQRREYRRDKIIKRAKKKGKESYISAAAQAAEEERKPFDRTKARLQELGPRFTLKLKKLHAGLLDDVHGEYEWIHHPDMATTHRKFFL